jgi:hypothetical protein
MSPDTVFEKETFVVTSTTGDQGTSGYISLNGRFMYYESQDPDCGTPLPLLYGGVSATGTSFGKLLPSLAQSRRVIAREQQAHGHTADIDRPLSQT